MAGEEKFYETFGLPSPDIRPEEDFSPKAALSRTLKEREYEDTQAFYSRPEFDMGAAGAIPSPREMSSLYRYRKASALNYINQQIPNSLDRFPGLSRALVEANIDEKDARNLINLVELDNAANAIAATNDPIAHRNILLSMNEVQRAAFLDFLPEKIEEWKKEAEKDPSWASRIWNTVYEWSIEPTFTALTWANETAQQAYRANVYAVSQGGGEAAQTAIPLVGPALNAVKYWDQVAPGRYNQEYLDQLRAELGPNAWQVDVILRGEELMRDGQGDPLGRWIAE